MTTPATPAVIAPELADWASLVDVIAGCTACGLAETRQRVVPGVYPAHARVLLVGEAPGRSEDEGGLPFIGRSGRLLDELLAEVGLDRAQVAVCNTVKCRPPDNRTPKRAELATCRPWLDRQIELIAAEQGGLVAGSQIKQEGERTVATVTLRVRGTGRRCPASRRNDHLSHSPGPPPPPESPQLWSNPHAFRSQR